MKKFLVMILVNFLTMIRIIGVFCLVPVYTKHGGIAAGILSIFCYFTDCLDGIIARSFHVATFFGSVFDSIADKAFSCANLIVLLTITKFAIIPILFEFAIVIIQTIKFSKNVNIQSSFAGKAKTWVISLTVIVLYLISDIQKITFLSDNLINYVINLNPNVLYAYIFIPLYIFEILTLVSYLRFLNNYNPKEKIQVPQVDLYLKNPKNLKDVWNNFAALWLNNEFYEKYKDSAGLKDIRRQVKANRID